MILKACFLIIWMQLIKRRVSEMASRNRNLKRKNRLSVTNIRNISRKTGYGRLSLRSGRRSKGIFADASLDDMIAASRIVTAHQDGIAMEIKLSTDKAKSIATHIIAQKPKEGTVKIVSPHQLNKAILQRNKKENKPTEKTIEIYKKMVAEE